MTHVKEWSCSPWNKDKMHFYVPYTFNRCLISEKKVYMACASAIKSAVAYVFNTASEKTRIPLLDIEEYPLEVCVLDYALDKEVIPSDILEAYVELGCDIDSKKCPEIVDWLNTTAATPTEIERSITKISAYVDGKEIRIDRIKYKEIEA